MYKTKIKISNVNNLTDARYFAAREVDYIGYSMNESDGGINAIKINAIKEWVEGPETIIEVGLEELSDLPLLYAKTQPALIQLPGFVNREMANDFFELPILKEVVVELPINEVDILNEISEWNETPIVLDFSRNNISWSDIKEKNLTALIQNIVSKNRIWLDLPCENFEWEEVLAELNPYGISIKSSGEEKVGYKSFDEMDELLDSLSK